MNLTLDDIRTDITSQVKTALQEDIGSGDITAMLIPENETGSATIITRESCIFCGQAWLEETFIQVGGIDKIEWQVKEGDQLKPGDTLVKLYGNTRSLLTGERTALNFIQLLSGVATKAHEYTELLGQSNIKLLDTRKTIPSLRTAQKYAVTIGGCHNHRIGLFDAFLIKENHIAGCGSIQLAIQTAKANEPNKPVEVEVENIAELKEAIEAEADIVMLDNFSTEQLVEAMTLKNAHIKYEVSGNLTKERIQELNRYDIDFMSFGALTKHVRAVDLSFRLTQG